jgi:hypothetical protein
VHPIEHLRYVARARGADPASLVRETAQALSSMRFDPSGLVVACRRIVERHPDCGPLWWLCARLLTSPEPFELAWCIADEIDRDPTADVVAASIPDDATVLVVGWPDVAGHALLRRGDVHVLVTESRRDGQSFLQRLERHGVPCDLVPGEGVARAAESADLVVVDAAAVSERRVVAPIGSAVAVAVARSLDVPVWLVAALGRRLPAAMVDAIADRVSVGPAPWGLRDDVFAYGLVTHVVGPRGVVAADRSAVVADCPMAPELLRSSPI